MLIAHIINSMQVFIRKMKSGKIVGRKSKRERNFDIKRNSDKDRRAFGKKKGNVAEDKQSIRKNGYIDNRGKTIKDLKDFKDIF
jgi:hypothetical protein